MRIINIHVLCSCRFKATDISETAKKSLLKFEVPPEIAEVFTAKELWQSIMESDMNELQQWAGDVTFREKVTNTRLQSYTVLFTAGLEATTAICKRNKGRLFGAMSSYTVLSGETGKPIAQYPADVVFKYRV